MIEYPYLCVDNAGPKQEIWCVGELKYFVQPLLVHVRVLDRVYIRSLYAITLGLDLYSVGECSLASASLTASHALTDHDCIATGELRWDPWAF